MVIKERNSVWLNLILTLIYYINSPFPTCQPMWRLKMEWLVQPPSCRFLMTRLGNAKSLSGKSNRSVASELVEERSNELQKTWIIIQLYQQLVVWLWSRVTFNHWDLGFLICKMRKSEGMMFKSPPTLSTPSIFPASVALSEIVRSLSLTFFLPGWCGWQNEKEVAQ